MFCDAAHVTDLITRRSTTGIIFFLFNTPIIWYAKRQNTIESSTFGSEFVVLKIASELNDALHYKLRMFGMPIIEPTKTYCDNEIVVKNATIVTSTLAKNYNSIAYHKGKECVVQKTIEIHFTWSKGNIANFLTKFLPHTQHDMCCNGTIWHQRPQHD